MKWTTKGGALRMGDYLAIVALVVAIGLAIAVMLS